MLLFSPIPRPDLGTVTPHFCLLPRHLEDGSWAWMATVYRVYGYRGIGSCGYYDTWLYYRTERGAKVHAASILS